MLNKDYLGFPTRQKLALWDCRTGQPQFFPKASVFDVLEVGLKNLSFLFTYRTFEEEGLGGKKNIKNQKIKHKKIEKCYMSALTLIYRYNHDHNVSITLTKSTDLPEYNHNHHVDKTTNITLLLLTKLVKRVEAYYCQNQPSAL